MNLSLNLYLLCVTIAICNLLFTAFLLMALPKTRNQVANRLLATLLVCLGVSFLSDLLSANGFFDRYPHLFEYDAGLSLCLGPLLYYYIRLQIRPDQRPRPIAGLHLLPILLYGLLLSDFLLSDADTKRAAIAHPESIPNYMLAQYLKKGQILLYGLGCYRLLLRHNRVVEDVLSSPDNRRLTWLRHLLVAVAGLFAVWVVSNEVDTNILLLGPTLLGFSYWVAYHGISQEPVFDRLSTQSVLPFLQAEPEVRYRNSTLTKAAIESSKQQFEQHMVRARPYLDPALTLTSLAEQLGLNPNHLSQVLNEGFGENFYTFINRHRVEESKRLLVDPAFSHYSILGIATEAGFGAKSTFNKTFREIVGLSPSEFVRQHRAGQPGNPSMASPPAGGDLESH